MSTVFFILAATFISTLLGGLLALRLRDKLHLIIGFSAGAVIAVAFFDLLPEALELSEGNYEPSTVLTFTALGFLLYLALDRLVLFHGHNHEHSDDSQRGGFGAAALSMHSFLDGIAIGFAFQVSEAVGLVVALAVLAHDFSDGINTVNMVLKNGGSIRRATGWLFTDALAPVLGILATFFITIPTAALGLLLAMFGGFFLYLGASDLIPEAHHSHPVRWTTISTILGVCVLYLVVRLASI